MGENKREVDDFLRVVALRTWETFKADPLLYVLSSILMVVFGVLTLGILLGPLYGGFIDIVRRQMRGDRATVQDLANGLQSGVAFLVTTVLVGAATAIGTVFVVLPGLLVCLLSLFSWHYIAYENALPTRAIRQSYELVKDNFLLVLMLGLALGVLSALSATMPLALLVAAPLSIIALTVAFEELTGAPEAVATAGGPETAIAPEPA
jgi:hypothetical protein